MAGFLQRFAAEFLRPLVRRPNRFQVAALCHRQGPEGLEVLVITSRDTGRWLLPKGWPMRGHDAVGAAVAEAWEEAGVEPRHVGRNALGSYLYDKRLRGGVPVRCEAKVFPIEVERLADEFPDSGQRERRWVTPEAAAGMVQEPGLRDILLAFPAALDAGRAR